MSTTTDLARAIKRQRAAEAKAARERAVVDACMAELVGAGMTLAAVGEVAGVSRQEVQRRVMRGREPG